MEITPPASGAMGPPMHSSPEIDLHGHMSNGVVAEENNGSSSGAVGGLNAAAATSSQQPKVVQTAFIHKLYRCQSLPLRIKNSANQFSMLEDPSIQHLISWSNNNESFVMSPSAEFGKTLAYVVANAVSVSC